MAEPSLPLSFLCLLALSSACYIQNCPRGGKRALADTALRQCMPCGPGNRGNCFGPGICCGSEVGCYLGTAVGRGLEQDSGTCPCSWQGVKMGAENNPLTIPKNLFHGHVLLPAAESCAMDTGCLDEGSDGAQEAAEEKNLTVLDGSAGDLLLKLMHLANRQQQQQQ
ncbi:NEUV protein, partial [Hylia prasina]|nr:NEUV protein [Hylia prasina]